MTDRSVIHAVLVNAKKQIEDPANWCQEWHYILHDGTPAFFSNLFEGLPNLFPSPEQKAEVYKTVRCCCVDGALLLQTGSDGSQAYIDTKDILHTEAQRLFGAGDHVEVNDGADGHANSMKLLDAAIAYAAQP